MFRKVEFSLMAFYIASIVFMLGVVYFIHDHLGYERWDIITLWAIIIAIGIGKIIAKMAIGPLKEHFEYLETFSKETLHELNLPISTIIANVDMLRKTHTDDKSLKRLERVEKAAKMLQERYNELDYLIKKQMEREVIEVVDVSVIVQERFEFLRGLYPHAVWNSELDRMFVHLDPIGLGKVIDNLIDNAVKYSGPNPDITLTLQHNVLRICDKGIGMDEITLMKVYDRYYQNDATTVGFGIGLHLVKRYCDRHNIGLQIHSKLGEGTCVALEFKHQPSL